MLRRRERPLSFWRSPAVRAAVSSRDIGRLLQLYLAAFPDCTQARIALLTGHDRSEISNWTRGVRRGEVSDIGVLTRVADGLEMPDETRVMLGIAGRSPSRPGPVDDRSGIGIVTGWYLPQPDGGNQRVALCGSRARGTDSAAIDDAVRSLGRFLTRYRCVVNHGPVGVGNEIITYIADHYRPPDLDQSIGTFGHHNLVRNVDYVLIIGGGSGTRDEVDLATSMRKRIVPFPASGGTARHAYDMLTNAHEWRPTWIDQSTYDILGACDADEYSNIVEHLLTKDRTGDDHA